MLAGEAAVGILRHGKNALLIRRMEFPGDPWSGNIAFPGGHIKNGESVRQGLLREIREEVNLDLGESDIVMELGPVAPYRAPDLHVYPFVLDASDLASASPGPEVADIKVVNLGEYRETKHPQNGFPALDYQGWIVWGLTYRIITGYIGIKRQY